MTDEGFLIFLQHFVKNIRPFQGNPVSILLDNFKAHLSIPVINLAKDNGVMMLGVPPHTLENCDHQQQRATGTNFTNIFFHHTANVKEI